MYCRLFRITKTGQDQHLNLNPQSHILFSQVLFEKKNSKPKKTGKGPNNVNTKDVEVAVPLKYMSNFLRTLEMPSINCEINLILTWLVNCVITNSTGARTFAITNTLCSCSNFTNSR